VAALCGIGFTMSLFIGLLAFNDPAVQDHIKMGILLGSVLSGVAGAVILSLFKRRGPIPEGFTDCRFRPPFSQGALGSGA
jgi:Na+/H+ antiporter NhaA